MRPEIRLGLFYALTYGVFGVYLPYWPLWLRSRGLSADEIGWFLSAATLAKIIAVPLAAALADRLGRRRAVIVGLSVLSLAVNGLYFFVGNPALAVATGFLAAFCLTPVMALTDTLALALAQLGRFDYGRVRLFGFTLVAFGTGQAMAGEAPDFLLWSLLFFLVLSCVGAVALPEVAGAGNGLALRALLSGTRVLLRQPGLAWFLLAAGLIQNSHIVYYAFATIYWRDAGLGAGTIGWLWAEGVIAEICLFAAAPWFAARLGPTRLVMLGGAGAAIRWLALGLSTDLAVLLPMQLLHALSFAAAHLGAMLYLARTAPSGFAATALGLYTSLSLGVGSGLVYALTGVLIEHYGGAVAFFAMTVSALAGIAAMRQSELRLRSDSRYTESEG
jgi:PPP family 3-phenylpropionic acid transporter